MPDHNPPQGSRPVNSLDGVHGKLQFEMASVKIGIFDIFLAIALGSQTKA